MKMSKEIIEPVKDEMIFFYKKFHNSMFTKVPLLNRIINFIIKRKGKQIRPILVFLCAKLVNNGKVLEKTYRGASVIELIHTATLVHDDVIDESNYRRGYFSIKALWKNKTAILVGDYLLSKGLLLCIENKDFDLLEVVSLAVKEMSEGELLQIEKSRELSINEPIYFEVIKKKTASLILACCATGVNSVSKDLTLIKRIMKFGEFIGIAFQIKDDLLDYSNEKIGKPKGIDIKSQRMTLPFIYVLENSNLKDRKWLINSVKKYNKDSKRVSEVIKYVKNRGGVKYAEKNMFEFHSKALKVLLSFPKNKYRDSLEFMAKYMISRKS
ncbi:MAG: polyprenyl synthetase family protein [Flavobacteriaceae bacterium]|nr:polyprenyl synthetase family protein [Flavobacteriaceae bacterium]